jgi:hypothetical protein
MSPELVYLCLAGLSVLALATLRQSGVDSADERIRDGE